MKTYPASRDNSHNISAFISRMSAKSLWYNAPGETRTPNLLIRSQLLPPTDRASTAGIGTVAATQIPKRDTSSQNNSRNGSWEVLYSGSRPLALYGWWTT